MEGGCQRNNLVARHWFHGHNGAIRLSHLFLTELSRTANTPTSRITFARCRAQRTSTGVRFGLHVYACCFLKGRYVCAKIVCYGRLACLSQYLPSTQHSAIATG